jgi:hypothetical protein
VQFPPTNVNNANAIPHPYEKIALKERTGKLQRFGGEVLFLSKNKSIIPKTSFLYAFCFFRTNKCCRRRTKR